MDVRRVLPPCRQHQVLAQHHPVKVFEGEIGLDVEDDVLADRDLLVGATDVDVAVVGGVGGVRRRLGIGAAALQRSTLSNCPNQTGW